MDNRQRERCDSRIIQPEWGTRNVNNFYESEAWRIAALNETSRQGAKAAFDGRNGCQKCFCVTFDESNKAYAPYPALITARKGERRVIEENDQFYDRQRLCQP